MGGSCRGGGSGSCSGEILKGDGRRWDHFEGSRREYGSHSAFSSLLQFEQGAYLASVSVEGREGREMSRSLNLLCEVESGLDWRVALIGDGMEGGKDGKEEGWVQISQ